MLLKMLVSSRQAKLLRRKYVIWWEMYSQQNCKSRVFILSRINTQQLHTFPRGLIRKISLSFLKPNHMLQEQKWASVEKEEEKVVHVRVRGPLPSPFSQAVPVALASGAAAAWSPRSFFPFSNWILIFSKALRHTLSFTCYNRKHIF